MVAGCARGPQTKMAAIESRTITIATHQGTCRDTPNNIVSNNNDNANK